ncbi:hypothetical protein [Planococcus beijingensis]|uniref:hypothetical protein n=1 Tax=Planococcus beijingensis TaxID=2782551 RepID=UPI00193B5409|nr:hypothetical protein [Planococcus beijingensis]
MNQQQAARRLESTRKPVQLCSFAQLFIQQPGTFPLYQIKRSMNKPNDFLKILSCRFPHEKQAKTRRLIFVNNEQLLILKYFLY